MDKMPERIWVQPVPNDPELCHATIYLEEELENMAEQDIIKLKEYCRSTPLLEHAGEMRKLVNSQRLIINRLSSLLSYHADVKITDEKDYMSRFVPVEITILKRAKKRSAEVKNLLAIIEKEEKERGGR